MILSVTLSKPAKNIEDILGKSYEKIKIKAQNSAEGTVYFAEMFTKTQVFHQKMGTEELQDFISKHAGTTFKNCVQLTESEEITILANKKGKVTTLTKLLASNQTKTNNQNLKFFGNTQKKKNYLIQEGNPVPFMVLLGIMNSDGKVLSQKYDKFRQINRFLEFINDVLPEVTKGTEQNSTQSPEKSYSPEKPIRIVDFGCGKSYLTFAVHYFLTEIKKLPCEIEGLDLKEEVIDYCNDITEKLGLKNLVFKKGNIADYSGKEKPDIIITLHACDTATDYALQYAVEREAKVILSVPCCQHQINQQLNKISKDDLDNPLTNQFEPLLKWGIIQEKFASLVTDALRGQWLENQGYKVQMLEFIDIEHTPKNILIRAIKKGAGNNSQTPLILESLKLSPEIFK